MENTDKPKMSRNGKGEALLLFRNYMEKEETSRAKRKLNLWIKKKNGDRFDT